MGRPLKIRKYDPTNGNQVVDQGYPNNGQTNNGYDGDYPGIVGGVNEDSDMIKCQASVLVKGIGTITTDSTSTTVTGTDTHFTTDAFTSTGSLYVSDGQGGYTLIGGYDSTTNDTELELDANAAVDVTDSAWFYTVVTNAASIVRQKAQKKFMVATTNNAIQDESIAPGQAYMISSAGNTDWQALGAGPNAGLYDIFTALKSGAGLGTTGAVWPIATCVLVDDATPTDPNTMSVAIDNNGSTVYASKIQDHFVTDFSTPFGTECNPGTEYVATFFTNSGTDAASGKDIVAVENWC